jgi:hypothetical protein
MSSVSARRAAFTSWRKPPRDKDPGFDTACVPTTSATAGTSACPKGGGQSERNHCRVCTDGTDVADQRAAYEGGCASRASSFAPSDPGVAVGRDEMANRRARAAARPMLRRISAQSASSRCTCLPLPHVGGSRQLVGVGAAKPLHPVSLDAASAPARRSSLPHHTRDREIEIP